MESNNNEKIKTNKDKISTAFVQVAVLHNSSQECEEHICQSIPGLFSALCSINPDTALELIESLKDQEGKIQRFKEEKGENFKKLESRMREILVIEGQGE